jgi:hypothetical protein
MNRELSDQSISNSTVTTEYSFMLKPSVIDVGGVGVFATHEIASGTYLRLFDLEDYRMIDLKPNNHFLLERFGVPGNQICCPKDLGRMSIGWYLNHSSDPNAYFKDDGTYYALKTIRSDEEITIDYEKFVPTE